MFTKDRLDKINQYSSDAVAFLLAFVILIYAASGPIGEFVQWFIQTTTADWEELSRREKRVLLKTHWLGSAYRSFEQGVLLPTGMILGLPILLGFLVTSLKLHKSAALNWALSITLTIVLVSWISNLFATDGGILPSAKTIDYFFFPIAMAITLYLTWRLFGSFIVGFCVFWIIYFFIRGYIPDWGGIFAGSESTASLTVSSTTPSSR